MMATLRDPKKMSIGQLFFSDSVRSLEVPRWQRFYSWKQEQVKEFWADLANFVKSVGHHPTAPNDYFLGTVILIASDSSPTREVLDGQQRLVTISVLCSELVKLLDPIDHDAANQISDEMLIKRDKISKIHARRITLTAVDEPFFVRHIIKNEPLSIKLAKLRRSHRALAEAQRLLADELTAYIIGLSAIEQASKLSALYQCLRDRVLVIAVISDSRDSAAVIFETINDRGLYLSASELVRMQVLQRAPDADINTVIQLWDDINNVESQPKGKNFLRHAWIATHGDVKARALSKTINSELAKPNSPNSVAFSTDLSGLADLYDSILTCDVGDQLINQHLQDAAYINAQSLYPAFLSTLTRWPTDIPSTIPIAERLIANFLNAYVRFVLVGEKEGSRFETLVYGLAVDISKGKLTEHEVTSRLKRDVPSDIEFENSFKEKVVPYTSEQQYILRKIEESKRVKNVHLGTLLANPVKTHVDHIYPRRPEATAKWADHEEWIDRIGNHTLMAGGANKSAQNKLFLEKRAAYRKSDLLITQELAKYKKWTSVQIASRQADLAKLALTVWKFR